MDAVDPRSVLADLPRPAHLRELFAADPGRADRYVLEVADLRIDWSKQLVDDAVLAGLIELAEAAGVTARRDAMFAGEHINVTEDRAVMHVALRAPRDRSIVVDGVDVVPAVHEVLDQMASFADRVRAVFHCFPHPWPAARQVLDLGGIVSFTGIVTFPNAAEALDCARRCPAGSFMVETDAPYLAPVPMRGKRNQPAYVRHIADHLATTRGESLEQLASHTNATAEAFFRFSTNPKVS